MTVAPPRVFDLRLAALPLERGGLVAPHVVRGWWWGPAADFPALAARAALLNEHEPYRVVRRAAGECADDAYNTPRDAPSFAPDIPTVLLVHALTGDMRAGGEGGWWAPLIGPGRAIDPTQVRVLCFNNLGSCYGTSGPADEDFPSDARDPRLPAAVTTWDQAASILAALEQLGVGRVALAAGGSLGGMIALALGALAPARVERLALFAASAAASAWLIGWNHVAREALLLDPGFPSAPDRGLAIARQLAMLTYRAEPGLDARQGRAHAGDAPWSAGAPYRVQTYLAHQGEKLVARFDARAYLAQLGAMDHHDIARPPPLNASAPGDRAGPWGGLGRVRASTLAAAIDTDQLYSPAQTARLATALEAHGAHVEQAMVQSEHGHDAFLIEWDQLATLLSRALAMPAFGGAR